MKKQDKWMLVDNGGSLYLYAADGEVPEQFDRGLLESAFGPKR